MSYPAYAGVVKLADTPDLGSGAARCAGSSPVTRIDNQQTACIRLLTDTGSFACFIPLLKSYIQTLLCIDTE